MLKESDLKEKSEKQNLQICAWEKSNLAPDLFEAGFNLLKERSERRKEETRRPLVAAILKKKKRFGGGHREREKVLT